MVLRFLRLLFICLIPLWVAVFCLAVVWACASMFICIAFNMVCWACLCDGWETWDLFDEFARIYEPVVCLYDYISINPKNK